MPPKLTTKRPTASAIYQTIPVQDMTGGLDLRRSPTLVKPDRSVVCKNFSLSEPGALRVRPGLIACSSNHSTGRDAQGAQRIYLGSTQGTLVASQGHLYLLPDSGTWPSTAVYSTLSTGAQVHFIFDRNLGAATDGV